MDSCARGRPSLRKVIGMTAMPRLLCVLVAAASIMSGCGEPKPLDPTSATIASQKKAAVESLLQGARAAADQFGAGTALGVRTDTVCTRGTKNWKIHDLYRSTCTVQLTTAYAVDISPMPALSGLEERLKAEGWYPRGVGWTLTRGRGDVVDLAAWNRHGYHLEDLVGVGYTGPQAASLGFRPVASSTPVCRR